MAQLVLSRQLQQSYFPGDGHQGCDGDGDESL